MAVWLLQQEAQHLFDEQLRINIHGYMLLAGKGYDATVGQR
jgi:hypothetical protein